MEWGTVSTASMAGMTFTLIVSVVLPIVLAVFVWRKMGGRPLALLVGAGIFIFFAMTLEPILHAVVFTVAQDLLSSNVFLYALYGGLAAALFEETGRYVAMRFFMRNGLNRENALMYGIGHGGTEAILITGMSSLNNLAAAALVNSGEIGEVVSQLDAEAAKVTTEQLTALWQSPAYLFYMGGVERISALILQIGLSLLVFHAVKEGQKKSLGMAFATHFLIDFLTVLAANFFPVILVELVLLILSAGVLWYGLRLVFSGFDWKTVFSPGK